MITMMEYAKRRQALMQRIGANDIVILPAAQEVLRNGDALYPFRQDSDFYYLTGFSEPEAMLVLAPKRAAGEYLLFNRVRDRDRETWDGPRAGQDGARKDFLADQAFPISDFKTMLPELLLGREAVHYPIGIHPSFDRMLLQAINDMRARIRSGVQLPATFADILPSIHEMRLFKNPAEISMMQKAIDISAKAHLRAMRACRPGLYEYQLEAELMYEFLRHGARSPAYSSIVGTGRHTCILHYINNTQKIADGDLVLIDAGAEYQQYASDITRTFPANGRFTAEQRTIYELVFEAQRAAIQAIKPQVAWTKMQEIVVKVITQGLIDLGILKGRLDDLIEKQAYLPFYMHRSGHFLGLDVHDVGRYRIGKQWRKLEPGMVFTVEPGLYLSSDIPGLNKRWHHVGVRIEDDVLVTAKGCDVLSRDIPKKIDDIEAMMASR